MAMIISQANSLRFRRVDNALPNFDNVLLANEKFYNDFIETYCQRWATTDTVTVQIKSDSATVPTITAVFEDNSTQSIIPVGNTYKSRYDTNGGTNYNLWFFEFILDMSQFQEETYLIVSQDSTVYQSEPFRGDPDLMDEVINGETLKIEYYNTDNAFQIDFSTGITFCLYVKAIIQLKMLGGEKSIYDNQDTVVKLKETKSRTFEFKTVEIPKLIWETIDIAFSTDNLSINEVSLVCTESNEPEKIEGHNFVYYSADLIQSVYLGTNSHDIGFDCDSIIQTMDIINLAAENASGASVHEVKAGYLVHVLRAKYVSGTAVQIKLGTTVGGDELVYPFEVSGTLVQSTVAIHGDVNRDSNANIYLTVTGGVANIDIQTIKNIV